MIDRPPLRVLVNALPICIGGGLRKTLSFLDGVSRSRDVDFEFVVICRRNDVVHEFCVVKGIQCLPVRNSYIGRALFEMGVTSKSPECDVVFNIGGTCMLRFPRGGKTVTEFAYSNILYPEVRFWRFESFLMRVRGWIVDKYRKRMARKSDFLILQTSSMRNRAVRYLRASRTRTLIVNPSFSSHIHPSRANLGDVESIRFGIGADFSVLFACGEQRHKRLHLLPEIAREIMRLGRHIKFVITIDVSCVIGRQLAQAAADYEVSEFFHFVGKLDGEHLAKYILACDAMANIAVLESFSNNFVEAWLFGRPLIATNDEWARESAGDAAVFIDPENPALAAREIIFLMDHRDFQARLVELGRIELRTRYQTPENKYRQYLNAFEFAAGRRH